MNSKNILAASAAALMVGSAAVVPAQAGPVHHFLHKHRTATTLGAAIAAHHYAKKGAQSRIASGRKPNFAERHPTLSAIGAAAATHHILKKH